VKTLAEQVVALPDDLVVEGLMTDFRPREALAIPIVYKGAALGVVVVASTSVFGPEARRLAGQFRLGMALALNNSLAHDRLQRLAALDPLTGLYNRRFGLERLKEEYGRARRSTSPLAVIMFDIDHFKAVNDTYGHLAGDRVLVRVARVARGVVRQGDVLLRYGGEEFAAILPGASLRDAAMVAERMRRIVGEALIKEGEAVLRVTISLGVVSCPELDVASQEDLLRTADELLYKAKANGRDRVERPA
jgi:diguanylate cyclase (GGDEF)-like protein